MVQQLDRLLLLCKVLGIDSAEASIRDTPLRTLGESQSELVVQGEHALRLLVEPGRITRLLICCQQTGESDEEAEPTRFHRCCCCLRGSAGLI